MANQGTRTTDLPLATALDEVIGNVTGIPSTFRMTIEALVSQLGATGAFIAGNSVYVATLPQLEASSPPSATAGGVVYADQDREGGSAANNGFYVQSAPGVWQWARGLPDTVARVTLSGDANAQTGTVSHSVDPANVEMFIARVTTPNTGPMNLDIPGLGEKEVVNVAGNALAGGEWTGIVLFWVNESDQYQMLIDAGAAASAAQSAAEAGSKATLAGLEADRAKEEADRAEGIADNWQDLQDAVDQSQGYRNEAESFRDEAELARDQAIAAAEASGDVLFFDTFADADAAMPLANEQVVRIFSDETVGDRQTFYRVEDGDLVRKLVVPETPGINVLDFGADPTGTNNSLSVVQAAAIVANDAQRPLVFQGKIRLSGAGDIVINTDADFSGCELLCEDWEGKLVFGRTQGVTTYTTGPVVTGLTGSSDLGVGSSVFSGWDGVEEVDDSFIIVNTDQDFYRFRSNVRKRLELNRIFKEGVAASPLRYALTGVGVDSVEVLPMEPRRRRVTGLTLNVTGNDLVNEFVRIETSLLDIDVRFVLDRAPSVDQNVEYIRLFKCCSVNLRAEMQWTNRSAAGWTYNIRMDYCYDINITAVAEGDGWGATGSNLCQRITFTGGQLSRIDFHEPIMEWLRIIGTTLGDWGVLVTMLGDLHIQNAKVLQRTFANVNNSGVIRSREDTGGFCDGDLIVSNLEIVGDAGSGEFDLIRHMQAGSYTNTKPSASPINYRFWRRIIIDGLKHETGATPPNRLLVRPALVQSGTAAIAVLEEFTLHNAYSKNLWIEFVLSSVTPSRPGSVPLKLDFENVVCREITAVSTSAACPVVASYRNCRGVENDGFNFEATATGTYMIEGGCVALFDFFSGASPAHPVRVRAYGVRVQDTGAQSLVVGTNANVDCRLIDCEFHTDSSARFNSLLGALLVRPRFFVSGAEVTFVATNVLEGTGTLTFVATPRDGQVMRLLMGYTSSNQYAVAEVIIPPINQRTIVAGHHESTGPAFGTLQRTGANTISATGNVRFRRLELGLLTTS